MNLRIINALLVFCAIFLSANTTRILNTPTLKSTEAHFFQSAQDNNKHEAFCLDQELNERNDIDQEENRDSEPAEFWLNSASAESASESKLINLKFESADISSNPLFEYILHLGRYPPRNS